MGGVNGRCKKQNRSHTQTHNKNNTTHDTTRTNPQTTTRRITPPHLRTGAVNGRCARGCERGCRHSRAAHPSVLEPQTGRCGMTGIRGSVSGMCKPINRSHAHRTHRQRKHPRHRHTHAHNKEKKHNEHLPQALNNARRWRDDGTCHLSRPPTGDANGGVNGR